MNFANNFTVDLNGGSMGFPLVYCKVNFDFWKYEKFAIYCDLLLLIKHTYT